MHLLKQKLLFYKKIFKHYSKRNMQFHNISICSNIIHISMCTNIYSISYYVLSYIILCSLKLVKRFYFNYLLLLFNFKLCEGLKNFYDRINIKYA